LITSAFLLIRTFFANHIRAALFCVNLGTHSSCLALFCSHLRHHVIYYYARTATALRGRTLNPFRIGCKKLVPIWDLTSAVKSVGS
jgi:hypothetical protein